MLCFRKRVKAADDVAVYVECSVVHDGQRSPIHFLGFDGAAHGEP